jgi:hypothetical protein
MELASRPWAIAGVALAAASVVAVTPMTKPIPNIEMPVALSASDFFELWQDVLNTASANATLVEQDYFEAPLPAVQQIIVNQFGFLDDFLSNPGSIGTIFGDIADNFKAGFNAPFVPFIPAADSPVSGSLDSTHQTLFNLLITLLPTLFPGDQTMQQTVESVLTFLSSPAGGLLLGSISTVLSPLLEFRDDFSAIVSAIGDGDWTTVLQDVLNLPASLTGAYLNGYGPIDLLPLLNSLGVELPSIPGLGNITTFDLDLGGLVSPGGSAFNALGLETMTTILGRPITTLSIPPGEPAGPVESLVQLTQSIAQALGWDTVGNPLTELTFPTLDFGALAGADASTGLAATDLATLWTDLLGGA